VRTCSLLLLFASNLLAFGQSGDVSAGAAQLSQPSQSWPSAIKSHEPDELKQELDANAIILSKIPAEPPMQPDPVAPILRPVNRLVDTSIHSLRSKFGPIYTFLNQYATITPDGVRHDQPSGRLDFTGAWAVYDHERTAGSISLLIRSGTNIGMSQQFNLTTSSAQGCTSTACRAAAPRSQSQ
jgi:porin